MKTKQCKISILQGMALQINGMFLFSIYSIRWKKRRPIQCFLKEIMSYYVTVMIGLRSHLSLWLQSWQTKRFLPFPFSVFLLSLRLQDDKDYRHSGGKHWDYNTSIFLSSCVVFFSYFSLPNSNLVAPNFNEILLPCLHSTRNYVFFLMHFLKLSSIQKTVSKFVQSQQIF